MATMPMVECCWCGVEHHWRSWHDCPKRPDAAPPKEEYGVKEYRLTKEGKFIPPSSDAAPVASLGEGKMQDNCPTCGTLMEVVEDKEGVFHYAHSAPRPDKESHPTDGSRSGQVEDAPELWETHVLAAADAIIAEDYDEAYHQLYAIVEPTFTKPGCPFERLRERLNRLPGDET